MFWLGEQNRNSHQYYLITLKPICYMWMDQHAILTLHPLSFKAADWNIEDSAVLVHTGKEHENPSGHWGVSAGDAAQRGNTPTHFQGETVTCTFGNNLSIFGVRVYNWWCNIWLFLKTTLHVSFSSNRKCAVLSLSKECIIKWKTNKAVLLLFEELCLFVRSLYSFP